MADIPNWARWKSIDEDGTINVYNYRPEIRRNRRGGYWGGDFHPDNRAMPIGNCGGRDPNWRFSLEKLEVGGHD